MNILTSDRFEAQPLSLGLLTAAGTATPSDADSAINQPLVYSMSCGKLSQWQLCFDRAMVRALREASEDARKSRLATSVGFLKCRYGLRV
jgi:hypothetical protein